MSRNPRMMVYIPTSVATGIYVHSRVHPSGYRYARQSMAVGRGYAG